MNYYREKICSLVEKMFCSYGNGKDRLTFCQKEILSCYIASKGVELPKDVENFWNKFNEDVLSKIIIDDSIVKRKTIYDALRYKKYKTVENYLLFFFEEYNRLRIK